MPRHPHKASNMCDLYPAICLAVRGIKDAEKENFANGIHQLQGKRDTGTIRLRTKCYDKRDKRLADFGELLNLALPAGIKAGFSGEYVEARLRKLLKRAEKAAYWDANNTVRHDYCYRRSVKEQVMLKFGAEDEEGC
jgi:hypothetical protein